MTHKEIFEMLKSSGLPVVYYSWPEEEAPQLPYLVFYYPSNADEFADNRNFQRNNNLNVELYTEDKEFELEEQIGELLNDYGLTYSKSQTYLDTEEMYEILYESEVIING